jgi:predicted ATP-grasp superfamily ATP-dependent carboligase
MDVLVLDGNENQAVAAVRSLARAGHRVTVGAPTSWSKAGWSRACSGTFTYPSPQADADAFVDRVLAQVQRLDRPLVLPMTERTTLPISLLRERLLAAGARLVLPAHEVVLRAFDKRETGALARQLGIAVPRTVVLSSPEEARAAAPTLPYPVVLKPSTSEETTTTGGTRTTGAPLYARTPDDFVDAFARMSERCRSVIVQEFVEGQGVGYFALMRHGALRAEFAHRRLRDVRPTGSGSSLRESTTPDPRLRAASLALLEALQWHGVAMVEFRQRDDGTLVFLEINGRFWNSLALAVYAGADFPRWLAELAEAGDMTSPADYRVAVRCRWLLGDVRHLLEVMRGRPAGFPGRFPRRLPTLAAFLRPVPGTRHDNFQWVDPLPEVGEWVHFIGRRVPAFLARERA